MAQSRRKRAKSRRVSGLDLRIASGQADPVTDSQRAAAARIRVAYNKKAGIKTEPWIKELAERA